MRALEGVYGCKGAFEPEAATEAVARAAAATVAAARVAAATVAAATVAVAREAAVRMVGVGVRVAVVAPHNVVRGAWFTWCVVHPYVVNFFGALRSIAQTRRSGSRRAASTAAWSDDQPRPPARRAAASQMCAVDQMRRWPASFASHRLASLLL